MDSFRQSTIYKVSSLENALELAWKFKREGRYDMFRGQPRNWDVISAIHRTTKKGYESAVDKIERLYYFLTQKKELEQYLNDINFGFAIAQHYGIPTNYIDFTTNPDIAAFFSTNSKKNKIGSWATIVCLNSKDFEEQFKFFSPIIEKEDMPEIIHVDVQNLWRLQAQEGCFLFTPANGIHRLYPYDRIVFPYKEKFAKISTNQIYPEHKSSLEILLDNYFLNEKFVKFWDTLRKQLPQLPITNLPKQNIFHFIRSGTTHDESWQNEIIEKWMQPKTEEWQDIKLAKSITLHVFSIKSNARNIVDLKMQLDEYMQVNRDARSNLLTFGVHRIKRPINKKLKAKIEAGCQLIWDGLRNLPYTDTQVSTCIARYIMMQLVHQKEATSGYFAIIPHGIDISMAMGDGSYTKASVCGYKLLASVRDNVDQIIVKKRKEELRNNPVALLQCVNEPQYLFKFDLLCDLFIEDIIPTQVIHRDGYRLTPVYFNPAYLTVLGLS